MSDAKTHSLHGCDGAWGTALGGATMGGALSLDSMAAATVLSRRAVRRERGWQAAW